MRGMQPDVSARIAFDGPRVADGTMDIRDLAPALLALGDLLQAANHEINGDSAELLVQVQSDFKSGSFDMGLGMILATHMGTLIPLNLATAKQIAAYVGLVKDAGMNFLQLSKWLKNEKPKVESAGDGYVNLSVRGTNNKVNVNVFKIYESKDARRALADALKPLRSKGIDTFEVRDKDQQVVEVVTKEELPAFTPPPDALDAAKVPPNTPEPTTMFIEVIKPSFRPNLRWAVSDGRRKFGALMRDPNFLRRVDSHEKSFTKGEILEVRMRLIQHRGPNGELTAEHEIVEVLGEVPPPTQTKLPE